MTLSLLQTLARTGAVASLIAVSIASERMLADELGDDFIAVLLLLIVALVGIASAGPVFRSGERKR